MARHPVGAGPYRLVRWQAGEELVFERNPFYHTAITGSPTGGGTPVERIIWRIIPDKMALAAALGRGEVDIAPVDGRIWQNYLAKDKATKDKLTMIEFNGGRTIYLGFNLERKPWSELAVRQAVASSVNRDAILGTLYGGFGVVPDTDVPLTSWAHIDGTTHTSYTPDTVAKILTGAGYQKRHGKYWRGGKPLGMRIMTIKDLEEVAQVVADDLRRVGIVSEVETIEYSTLRRAYMQKGKFDVVLWSRSFGPDPECSMVWGSTGALNFCRLKDPQVDKWLDLARTAKAPGERKQHYAELQKYLSKQLPWVFLVQPGWSWGTKTR